MRMYLDAWLFEKVNLLMGDHPRRLAYPYCSELPQFRVKPLLEWVKSRIHTAGLIMPCNAGLSGEMDLQRDEVSSSSSRQIVAFVTSREKQGVYPDVLQTVWVMWKVMVGTIGEAANRSTVQLQYALKHGREASGHCRRFWTTLTSFGVSQEACNVVASIVLRYRSLREALCSA